MPIFASTHRPVSKGGLTLNELLSWGLPFTAVLAFIGFAFAVLQFGQPNADDFWVARGFFVLAALVGLARVGLWCLLTTRPITIRLVVGVITFGLAVPFTFEAIRYVNRKSDRWVKDHQVTSTANSLSQPSVTTEEKPKAEPNVTCKSVERIPCYIKDGRLVEGRGDPGNRWIALAVLVVNEFALRPVGGAVVTGQITYETPDSDLSRQVNRGAWMSGKNRSALTVKIQII